MAPSALVAPIEVTVYPSFTRIFHHPSPTALAGGASVVVTPLSSTADEIPLILVLLIAFLGTLLVVWLCCRARTPSRSPAEVEAGATKEDEWSYGCTQTPKSSHVSSLYCHLPPSNSISAGLDKTRDTSPWFNRRRAHEDERDLVV